MNDRGAPLLPSFTSVEGFCKALRAALEADRAVMAVEAEAAQRLHAAKLPPITSLRALSVLLGVHPAYMVFLYSKRNRRHHYRQFQLRIGAKVRTVRAPRTGLKAVQQYIASTLAAAVSLPDHVHGFRRGRSIVSGAQPHCAQNWVYSLDIQDFFPSVREQMVCEALRGLGYPELGASTIAGLCTLDDQLPQGAPSSPVLSNICFASSDAALLALASEHRWTFTRYADDLTFSGNGEPPERLPELVGKLLTEHGWTLHPEKTHLMTARTGRVVLGLSVNGTQPKAGKRMRDRIRMAEHILSRPHDLDEDALRHYLGICSFGKMLRSRDETESCDDSGDVATL